LRTVILVLGIVFLSLIINSVVLGQNVQLSIPASSGGIGSEVSIPMNISDTTGKDIISVDMTLQYDPLALGIIDEDLSSPQFDGVIESSGTMTANWALSLATEPVPGQVRIILVNADPLSGSGVLVKIKFVVQRTARVGSTYPISFSTAVLNDGTPGVVTQNGIFTAEAGAEPERIPGDANGDDRVNHLDLLKVILKNHTRVG